MNISGIEYTVMVADVFVNVTSTYVTGYNTSSNVSVSIRATPECSRYIQITATVFFVIIFLTGFFWNVLMIAVICVHASKNTKTPVNMYLVKLCVADLLLLTVCICQRHWYACTPGTCGILKKPCYVSFCNNETIGGMAGCIDKMIMADPNFVMGHVIKLATAGKRVQTDTKFAAQFDVFTQLSKQLDTTPWEQKHIQALIYKATGHNRKACDLWDDILVEYPLDMLSLKLLYDAKAFEGDFIARRDCCARVMPYWKQDLPLYGDLQAMYAFGLEETNFYAESEALATKALDRNPYCVFASHCIAHCKEMTGKPEEGIQFMETTEELWNNSVLGCHCYWHWALFHYEAGDFESAAGILDTYMHPWLKTSKNMMPVTDVSSLCFRLEAEGYDVTRYWDDCFEVAKRYKDDRIWSFWDIHGMLSCVGAHQREGAEEIMTGVQSFISHGEGDITNVYAAVVVPVMEALQAYEAEEYDNVIDMMKPIRYQLHKVGASIAQRDILTLFSIHAGLRSKKHEHVEFARQLLHERKALRGSTDLTDRLLQQNLSQTADCN